LNTKGLLSNKELERGRKMLDKLQASINKVLTQSKSNHDRSLKRTLRGISELITERRNELFAPNVSITVNGRRKIMPLPRTNNTVEQDFRSIRRHGRRIRGDGDVERSVQRDGVGLSIVMNLNIEEYVRCVYNRRDQVAARFARVSMTHLKKAASRQSVLRVVEPEPISDP
jgi:hypothetical protein